MEELTNTIYSGKYICHLKNIFNKSDNINSSNLIIQMIKYGRHVFQIKKVKKITIKIKILV